jgi:iron(III) transport system permease protein
MVTAIATLVAMAVLLPPAYLLVRTLEGGEAAWDAASQPRTLRIVLDTLALAAAVTLSSIALSLPLAWLTARTDLPLRRLWLVVLSLPLVFPSYVAAYALVAAVGPSGLFQDLVEPLGISSLPDLYGFSGSWLVLVLIAYPYVLLTTHAGFAGLDSTLEEASRCLGKGAAETFLRVTLPALRPSIAAGAVLVALYTLSDFGAVSILRFDSLTNIIFIQYKSSFDRSAASALALVLVVVTLLVVVLESATRGRAVYHSRARRGGRLVSLGRWKWPAVAFCGAVATLALLLPLAVIVYWAVKGSAGGLSGASAVNSVSASGMAAVATVAAALPVAFLAARYPGLASSILEKAMYSGFALPGISIALALVFFAANFAAPLYQTMTLLVFAYAVRFLPEAVGSSRSSLLQVNPNTEEAARGLGAAPLRVFWRITLPQMLPGLSAAASLVFLTAMKELPITLLLSPIGFETLATDIWNSTSGAFFARAALPSLVLIGLSAIAVLLMVRRGGIET